MMESCSGYEEIVSSETDHDTLVQHMVDIHKPTAEFQKTCSIFCYSINCEEETQHLQLEPQENAFEKQIAGRWVGFYPL